MFYLNTDKLDGWHYIETQQDISFIFEQTHSFLDSVLKDLNYISGAYVDENNHMFSMDSIKQITMRLDSQWSRPFELVFEDVVALNLRPFSEKHSASIVSVSLFVKDDVVFFCDDKIDGIDESYDGTWIKAYKLRWRFCN